MEPEVRYHMLRPAEALQRRKDCPVAYVPLGTLEWHGVHTPLGTDTLQAEGLAILCAQKGGGLAFPPLYYGESRVERLVEIDNDDCQEILKAMELPSESFSPDRHPFTATEQATNYHNLLLHILAEIDSLGFKVGVLIAGHYPLVDYARAAVLHYTQRGKWMANTMVAWAFVDYQLVQDRYDCGGDHGGGWETSHIMALHRQSVDLSLLPAKGETIVGADGKLEPQDATAKFGMETLEAAAEVAIKEVHHRLKCPKKYLAHGSCLREGL